MTSPIKGVSSFLSQLHNIKQAIKYAPHIEELCQVGSFSELQFAFTCQLVIISEKAIESRLSFILPNSFATHQSFSLQKFLYHLTYTRQRHMHRHTLPCMHCCTCTHVHYTQKYAHVLYSTTVLALYLDHESSRPKVYH